MKVYHLYKLVGLQLRERPEEQPRAKLPAEPPAPIPPPAAPARAPATDAPFQLGEHKRVVKHADFLQCLDCNRQAGKVKSYWQDCRQLKIKKVKKRPTGFDAGTEEASSSGVHPAGEATGGLLPWANNVLSGNRRTGTVESGVAGSTGAVASGSTGSTGSSLFLIFRKRPREPD
eukprot:3391005-Amphidinium_carterae.2